MKTLGRDARNFVSGVVTYLKRESKVPTITPRVQNLLYRMTTAARRERQALVESSVKLTASEEQAISRMLATLVGHPVTVNSRVRADLVGGLRIKMADWVVDTSFAGKLSQMADLLG